ncbi:protein-glutamate O-methyltransferase CheR [Cohnella endophytica]|uniref:Protein-glutamate O-methyltransferase CheR n=1 Tax=Cohnella endophytica TaxID=2419778 RepID=A0A494X7R9_9BACL|nr:protein-glutamate O-methyltransferase CheR [Cohnella endophytica]RKP46775.1 protein-glutamate O-methyltransferase CheR [Cohnella endophytica]
MAKNNESLTPHEDIEKLEINLLLEGIYRHYGYDFRNYSFQSIRRRIQYRMQGENLDSILALLEKVLHDRQTMERLFADFSINVTEMFREPSFFLSFRRNIVPLLRNLPAIRIWHAGCSTGEEVYSMAILLHEEGLYPKTMLYATDMNDRVLGQAARRVFPLNKMQLYTRNYLCSGGEEAFSKYYTVIEEGVEFKPYLSENMIFSQHNLAIDHSFNEFHVIICRNVLIYFNDVLQRRVLRLFNESLVQSGYLGLGNKEGLLRSHAVSFEELDSKEKIYRKIVEPTMNDIFPILYE